MREFFNALKDEYDSRCAKELQKKYFKNSTETDSSYVLAFLFR